MPTGYTADVGDGKVTDFRTFALQRYVADELGQMPTNKAKEGDTAIHFHTAEISESTVQRIIEARFARVA